MDLLRRGVKPKVRQQLAWQGGAVFCAALLAVLVYGFAPALAVLYGGVVVLGSTGLLAWRMCRPPKQADAHKQLSQFYRTSLERLVLVCVMMAAGLGPLGLLPTFLLGGFLVGVVVQVAITVLIWKRAI